MIGAQTDTELDVDLLRRETPGAELVTHLNNAGAALMPAPVVDAMTEQLRLEATMGGYEAAERNEAALREPYRAIARLIGCRPDDVAITESATQAWSRAFYAIPFRPGDRILASAEEYGSNYLSLLRVAERSGATVEILPQDEFGRVSAEALRATLDERVRAVVVTHVPSHTGIVNPIAEIGAVAREFGALYLVDACQSAGHLPIDVAEIGCDFLSACGRKYLRGPRGTGFLYAKPSALDRVDPAMVGLDGARWLGGTRYELASGAQRFETWEVNAAAKLGLGVAVNYALALDPARTWARTARLADHLRLALAAVPGVQLLDRVDERNDLCGIVGFLVHGHTSERLRAALSALRINVWVCLANAACVAMESRQLGQALRASVHYYNTVEEIDQFCGRLRDIVVGTGEA
ncbi:aminotransferase class V-fold PLP-dependent enzyme [Solihabitans fulvus]|uniref:Aminotransferase class V-fold PLP-dependent enzyme n=1 Tax=Solihabitans fulvus TaxID=1892852 RepID=A0A5B2XD52_9PSEU|nr:aminotransferase class V-fold PLP-dependent enzyme [Solihabitans fulvus]KAA2261096.1 aminotransferase class V-fold PLP-dependent enzyme [Solihabitans fulvus]